MIKKNLKTLIITSLAILLPILAGIILWDKLPDVLDDKKKNSKITTLLPSLRVKGIITTDSPNQQKSYWILVESSDASNKKM